MAGVYSVYTSDIIIIITDHCEVTWYITEVLSVFLADDNFQRSGCRKLIFAHAVYLRGIWVKFVYEGHRIKVKVIGAKKVKKLPSPTM